MDNRKTVVLRHLCHINYQLSDDIVWSMLNRFMKDQKRNRITDKQHQIHRHQLKSEEQVETWLAKQGLSKKTFDATPIYLLKAQLQAHQLLTKNSNLLTIEQTNTIKNFQRLMAQKRTRERLKPSIANSILNISSKINRKLFKQHRQINKA